MAKLKTFISIISSFIDVKVVIKLMVKIVNFMVDESLLQEFDHCVAKLGLTRTELLVALMEFAVKCSKEGQNFLKQYLEALNQYSGETIEDARVLASYYKESFDHGKR